MGRLQWLGREISPSLPAAPNFLHYFLRDPLGAFFAKLILSGDVDQAVSEGRHRLASDLEYDPFATLEWGVPTLYRHVAASQLFNDPKHS